MTHGDAQSQFQFFGDSQAQCLHCKEILTDPSALELIAHQDEHFPDEN